MNRAPLAEFIWGQGQRGLQFIPDQRLWFPSLLPREYVWWGLKQEHGSSSKDGGAFGRTPMLPGTRVSGQESRVVGRAQAYFEPPPPRHIWVGTLLTAASTASRTTQAQLLACSLSVIPPLLKRVWGVSLEGSLRISREWERGTF